MFPNLKNADAIVKLEQAHRAFNSASNEVVQAISETPLAKLDSDQQSNVKKIVQMLDDMTLTVRRNFQVVKDFPDIRPYTEALMGIAAGGKRALFKRVERAQKSDALFESGTIQEFTRYLSKITSDESSSIFSSIENFIDNVVFKKRQRLTASDYQEFNAMKSDMFSYAKQLQQSGSELSNAGIDLEAFATSLEKYTDVQDADID